MKIEQNPNYCQVSITQPSRYPMEAILELKYISWPFPSSPWHKFCFVLHYPTPLPSSLKRQILTDRRQRFPNSFSFREEVVGKCWLIVTCAFFTPRQIKASCYSLRGLCVFLCTLSCGEKTRGKTVHREEGVIFLTHEHEIILLGLPN